MIPGISASPSASMTSAASGPTFPTPVMRPSETATSARIGSLPSPSSTVAPRITRSCIAIVSAPDECPRDGPAIADPVSVRNLHLVARDRETVRETLRRPIHVAYHVDEPRILCAQDFRPQLRVDQGRQERGADTVLCDHRLGDEAAFAVDAIGHAGVLGIERYAVIALELSGAAGDLGVRGHDEIAEAVKAGLPANHFDRLRHMRMMTEDQVGA